MAQAPASVSPEPSPELSTIQLSQQWSLEGRNFVVTGGTKGIGLATVQSLLTLGAATVVLCSRSIPDEAVLQQLRERHPSATIVYVACDVATDAGRATLLQATEQHVEELHGLINNVGMNVRRSLLEQTEAEYRSILQTNVDTAYFLCRMFHGMLRAAGGSCARAGGSAVVNVSSAAGVQSSGTGIAYAMSKGALNQMTRALACEWASDGIRANAVAPWMTMTPMLRAAVAESPGQSNPLT